ncbi:phytanoyl-CoA dioxygenase family protein [Cohnella nanjingensis]|uniref:Phytanoyl-CoA dioxygenase family protein n=1 Tax=Cohnella nanjingensis TaxID=1387779 RepID=A0A7X0RQ10_9BACL|nr:phytanoyl-CoA dioxygenase family protein [Cohnella nanjingensis]MBB6671450.1 phytanoyl-CoA dioxygenase family protein [Cohnella nanjingensis]
MNHSPMLDNDKKPISGQFVDSTPILENPAQLRERAQEDGMLFFKGLIPQERVLSLRLDILGSLGKYGVLNNRYPTMEAMADVEAINRYDADKLQWNGVGVTLEMYRDIQKLESFHALAHAPELKAMYRTLFGAEPFPHPRNIGRIMLPHRDLKATPSHQDFLHIQGATNAWTCWMPLGDVPRKLGGLAVLKGSHKAGLLGVANAPGAGGLESILCGLDYRWETTDYEPGDVLTFHSLTVHKSMPNAVPGKIRLSADYRYQPADEVIEPASLLPHGPYTWEELYEGWQRADLQYYWKDREFSLAAFDESIRWQKDKIC